MKETYTRREHFDGLIKIIKIMFAQTRELQHELTARILAFETFVAATSEDYPDLGLTLHAALLAARSSAGTQEKLREGFDKPLETFLARVAELQTEEELFQTLLSKKDDLIH